MFEDGRATADQKGPAPQPATAGDIDYDPGEEPAARAERSKPLPHGSVTFRQMSGLYVVAVTGDSVIIMDQHAAHERVLFEAALTSFRRQSLVSQRLLFPATIHLEPDDLHVFERDRDSFKTLGFLVSEFGPRQVRLEAVPAILGEKNPETLFRELLDDFASISGDEQKRFQKKAASFACRAAIMAGDKLDTSEMLELFQSLMRAENPYVCPHGRPTIIKITKDELDLKFGRH
jgi:DNA mismatch repair protein MutL